MLWCFCALILTALILNSGDIRGIWLKILIFCVIHNVGALTIQNWTFTENRHPPSEISVQFFRFATLTRIWESFWQISINLHQSPAKFTQGLPAPAFLLGKFTCKSLYAVGCVAGWLWNWAWLRFDKVWQTICRVSISYPRNIHKCEHFTDFE